MRTRNLCIADIIPINDVWEKYHPEFGIPHPEDVIADTVVETNDKRLAGYGCIARFAEAMIWLDKSLPKISLTKSLRLFFQAAIDACKSRRIKQLHVFVYDDAYAEMLKKHFKFTERQGRYLVLNLE